MTKRSNKQKVGTVYVHKVQTVKRKWVHRYAIIIGDRFNYKSCFEEGLDIKNPTGKLWMHCITELGDALKEGKVAYEAD